MEKEREVEMKFPLSPGNSVRLVFDKVPNEKELDQLQSFVIRLDNVFEADAHQKRMERLRASAALLDKTVDTPELQA